MNERIKQITGQVLDELVPETWTTLGYDKIKEIQNRTAELIVRECVGIVAKRKDQAIDDECNVDEAMSVAEMDLLEHFGVEE
jgi:hypothetical protein